MKKFKKTVGALALSAALAFCFAACSNAGSDVSPLSVLGGTQAGGGDSAVNSGGKGGGTPVATPVVNPSGNGGADIFASASAALRAMDISLDVSASTSVSNNMISKTADLKIGEIEAVDGTLPADKFFGIEETDKIGQGIGIDRWSDYGADGLSGKTGESQCMLGMCKKEVPDQISGLEFNKDFTQEVTANYTIYSTVKTIVLKKFRVNHADGSDEMTVFAIADLYDASDTARSNKNGTYNAILKCKKNAFETLDTELYMIDESGSQKFCAKFVRKSASEKTNTSWQSTPYDNNRWEEVSITKDGITGYKFANSQKRYINIKDGYSACLSLFPEIPGIQITTPYTVRVFDADGRSIKVDLLDNSGNQVSVPNLYPYYYLNFVNEIAGYKIKKVSSNDNSLFGVYKLVDADDQEVADVMRVSCYRFSNYSGYTYAITESEMKNKGLSCSVASQIKGMAESVKDHELKDEDYISQSKFDSSLPTALAAWLE